MESGGGEVELLDCEIPMLVCGRFGFVLGLFLASEIPILDRGRPAAVRCRLGGRGSPCGANSSGEALEGTRVEPAVVLGVAVPARLHFPEYRVDSEIVLKSVLCPRVLVVDTSPLTGGLPLRRGVSRYTHSAKEGG